MLRELGSILRDQIRKSDIACRFGGEEFLLVLRDTTLKACREHLEKIRELVRNMKILYGDQLMGIMTLSIGIIEASESGMSTEQLLKVVDKTLYAAKQAGRNRIMAFQDLEMNQG